MPQRKRTSVKGGNRFFLTGGRSRKRRITNVVMVVCVVRLEVFLVDCFILGPARIVDTPEDATTDIFCASRLRSSSNPGCRLMP
jgi:hypothetical protein